MDIYIFLDESGHLHKNSNSGYFTVGCIITTCCEYKKIKRQFKKVNLEIKQKNNYDKSTEIKASLLSKEDRQLYLDLFSRDYCYGIVVHKKYVTNVENESVWYNYLIWCILSNNMNNIKRKLYISCSCEKEGLNINIFSDNRNLVNSKLKSLEEYITSKLLEMEISNDNYDIEYNVKAEYVDSKVNYLVQYADIIANVLLIAQKQKMSYITSDQINLVRKNVKYSHFPSKKVKSEERF